MKYIKLYENLNTLKVGDYVIVKQCDWMTEEFYEFVNINIGKVVKLYHNNGYEKCTVEFETNLPSIPTWDTNFYPDGTNNFNYFFVIDDIEYWSKNREDLEVYINARKYNL